MCMAKLFTNDPSEPLLSCGEDVHCDSYNDRFKPAFISEVVWIVKLYKKTLGNNKSGFFHFSDTYKANIDVSIII